MSGKQKGEKQRQVRMTRPMMRSDDPTAIEVTHGWIPYEAAQVGRKYGDWKIAEVWGWRYKYGEEG